MSERVESFLRFLAEERRLSVNTLSAYRNDLRQFEQYLSTDRAVELRADGRSAAHDHPLVRVSRDEVVDFFLHLRERGYAPATIARKMAAVKSIFQFLHRRGEMAADPTASLGSPEVKKPLPRAISVDDIGTLICQARKRSTPEGVRDCAMLQVLCATGMRVTELVSLELDDVAVERGSISCTGRSGKRRELPVGETVVQAIRVYLRDGRPALLRADGGTTAMFLNHRGRRLTRQGFWLIMKSLARDSGLTTEVTPHTLRHSFAAHQLQDGLELSRLRELLGHANISTTQIYTQVQLSPEESAAVAGAGPVAARS
jgi:integrase/recombinase XerD